MYFSASQAFLGVVLSHGVNQLETDNNVKTIGDAQLLIIVTKHLVICGWYI